MMNFIFKAAALIGIIVIAVAFPWIGAILLLLIFFAILAG